MSRYQILALVVGLVLLIGGVFLLTHTHNPSNLYFTGMSFLFAGPAFLVLSIMSNLSERYDKLALLVTGLIVAGVLFLVGVIFAIVTYFF